MKWTTTIDNFKTYLTLEKSLSKNSVDAYINDITKLTAFLKENNLDITPEEVVLQHLKDFVAWINEAGTSPRTQARVMSCADISSNSSCKA